MIRGGIGRGTHWARSAVASIVIIVAAGCDSGQAPAQKGGPGPVIAVVNDSSIRMKDIEGLLFARGRAGAASKKDGPLVRALVEELVERRLILQHSRQTGEFVEEARVQALIQMVSRQYGSREELENALREEEIEMSRWRQSLRETLEIEQVLEREVYSKIELSEADILAYYDDNRGTFRVGKRWRVRQIVVRSEEAARQLRDRVVAGVSFALLARQASIGAERNRGGDMGLFSLDELPDKVQKVVHSLKGEEVSPVVQTSSGFHLFQVTERRSAGIQPFRAVRKKIYARLLTERGRAMLKKWIAGLKQKAEIRYYWRNVNDGAAG